MADPPSTAEVGGPPPDPRPPDNRCVYSLSPSEIAAINFRIQTTNMEHGYELEPSSPATGRLSPVINDKQPTVSRPSYADVAKHGDSFRKRKAEPSLHIFGQPPPLPGAQLISENGVETLVFDDEATNILTTPLKWSLVGKFSHKLPSSQTVGKFLATLKLSGEFDLSWLSHRQLLIVLSDEVDYTRIWTKGLWIIDGCPMRTLKWTPTFNPRIESPFAPVWVSLPGLPVHLFEKRALHLIASQLGRPLMVDAPTASRKRASLARICVEIDLLSPVNDVLFLRINGVSFQQSIFYEDMPTYCSHCNHIGHTIKKCFVKNVDLKAVYDEGRVEKKRKIKGKGPANELVVHDVLPMHPTAMANGDSADLRVVESGSVSVHSPFGQSTVTAATVDTRDEGEIVGVAPFHGDVEASMAVVEGVVSVMSASHFDGPPVEPSAVMINGPANERSLIKSDGQSSLGLSVESNALKPSSLTEDRSTAIVEFLTPFGVGSNMASVMESNPVALIKFLDKHPSMELYWDENSVLQCVDKDSGEYIEYAGVNSSDRQKFIEPPPLSNQTIVFAEPLQTIYQPHCYYPDMDALRAHLIPEADASECSLDDSGLDSEDSLLISGIVNTAFNSVYDGSGSVGDTSGYGGRVTRSMARKNVVPVVEADVVVFSEAMQGQTNSLDDASAINQAEFCAKPLQNIYPDKNEQINDDDDEDEPEFDDEMIMQALFKRCPTPDNTKSVFKDNFFAGFERRITRSKAKLL